MPAGAPILSTPGAPWRPASACAALCRAMLFVCAQAAAVCAAADPEASATRCEPPGECEGGAAVPAETWVDDSYEYVTSRTDALAVWLDSFFGTVTSDMESADSVLRLRTDFEWDQEDGEDYKVRLRGKVDLPRLDERLSLVFSEEDEEREEVIPNSAGHDDDVGLQYRVRERQSSRLWFTVGTNASLDFKSSLRYKYVEPIGDDWRVQFSERLYFKEGDGFGTITRGELDYLIHRDRIVRWINQVEYGEETDGVEWGSRLSYDLRLSEKDENEKKTMNTHLHILEAYTSLYRIWPDERLGKQLGNLVQIFTERIVDGVTGHLGLFFDERWNCRSSLVSYGHDIEASWLLHEAASALGEEEGVKGTVLRIAAAAHEGLADDGSLYYERDDAKGLFDRDRHWWVQSEAVVGFLNAWELSGDTSWLELASVAFDYIRSRLSDPVNGEWFWSIRADGSVNRDDDKAGFWKCPYHNSRMCLEILYRQQAFGNRQ